jgi:hypothetical protein
MGERTITCGTITRMSKVESSRPKTGGRKKGTPNRVTVDVRAAFAELAVRNFDRIQNWLDQVAHDSPAKAIELFIQLAEFAVPKLKAAAIDVRSPDASVKHLSYADLEARVLSSQ